MEFRISQHFQFGGFFLSVEQNNFQEKKIYMFIYKHKSSNLFYAQDAPNDLRHIQIINYSFVYKKKIVS